MIEATSDLVWAKDTEGRVILGNQATFDLLGDGDPQKVLAQGTSELFPVPEFAQSVIDSDTRVMTSGRPETVEQLFGPPDRLLIYQVAKSPLRDGAGKIVGLVGVSRDVTAAKKAADALRRSEQRFRLATELSKTIAFTYDRELRCTWSHGTQTGPGDDEIIGKTLHDLFVAESAEKLEGLYRRAMDGAAIREDVTLLSLMGSTPQVFDLFAEPLRDARGEIIGIIGAANNITARKRIEAALQENEERLRIALEASDLGAWDIDLSTSKATRSIRHDQIFGYEALQPEWSPEIAARHIVPEDLPVFHEAFARSKQTGTLVFQARVCWPNGSIHWIGASGAVIKDQEGRAVRMTGVVADITERKRAEEALRTAKAEAERASLGKSKFLAAASHDLRQPVQSLILLSGLLKRKVASDPKLVQIIGGMESAVQGLSVLLSGILDISRLDAGVVAPEMQPVEIGALIEQLSDEYRERAAKKGLKLRAKPSAKWGRSDPGLLQRALRNLIENALTYTRQGGVLIGARTRGERVRIDVVDTGIGVPADKRQQIFEEFTRSIARAASRKRVWAWASPLFPVSRVCSAPRCRSPQKSDGDRAFPFCCPWNASGHRTLRQRRRQAAAAAVSCSSRTIRPSVSASAPCWTIGAARTCRPQPGRRPCVSRRRTAGASMRSSPISS